MNTKNNDINFNFYDIMLELVLMIYGYMFKVSV
jgi:hypothetical protein